MAKYNNYKDTGIPWIGQIPLEWEVKRNKNVFSCNKNIVGSESSSTQLLSLTTNGIRKKNIDETGGKIPESYDTYQHVKANDIVMCLFDLDCSAVFSGLSKYDGMISPAYKILRCNESIMPGFADYWFRSVFVGRKFKYLAKNIRYSLTYEDFSALEIPCPTLIEQKAIVDYLDRVCSNVDSIIAEAQASIEEYKAWKASIIYEAVTKGLDPNVEMKGSGVEWIGKIPVGWNVQKLKTLVEEPLQYGANEAGIEYDESLPRYIRITDVTANGELKEEGKLSLSEDIAADYILNDGDILLARSGGTVGKAFYYKAEYGRAAFAGYMIRAKINRKKIDPKLVYFSTLSANYDDWKATSMTQATIQNIGANKYNEFYIVVPPIEKQAELVSYLEEKVVQIDNLIVEKESLINDLESYKKSLIFEVVTGKRKVV